MQHHHRSPSSRALQACSGVPQACETENCDAPATTIGLDGFPRCNVCQLDWLSAEEQGMDTGREMALNAAWVSVESGWVNPVELCSDLTKMLHGDEMRHWAGRPRREDVTAAVNALKDQTREAAI